MGAACCGLPSGWPRRCPTGGPTTHLAGVDSLDRRWETLQWAHEMGASTLGETCDMLEQLELSNDVPEVLGHDDNGRGRAGGSPGGLVSHVFVASQLWASWSAA